VVHEMGLTFVLSLDKVEFFNISLQSRTGVGARDTYSCMGGRATCVYIDCVHRQRHRPARQSPQTLYLSLFPIRSQSFGCCGFIGISQWHKGQKGLGLIMIESFATLRDNNMCNKKMQNALRA